MREPQIIVLMGTMSSGKSYFGRLLGDRLGWHIHDGDSDHTPANKEKMRAGIPLNDNDRRPWLEKISQRIKQWSIDGRDTIVICPAHKRSYRDILRTGGNIRLVHLHAPRHILQKRAQSRQHEYMNPNLIDSQLAILEPPNKDEHAISVNTDAPADKVLKIIITGLTKAGITTSAHKTAK